MSRIEELLGRVIEPAEVSRLVCLYDLRPEQLAEVSALVRVGRVPAVQYLQMLVRHSHLDHVADFLDQVVVGGADIASWGRRDQFCTIELEIASLLRLSLHDFAAALAPVGDRGWLRVTPDVSTWDGTSFCGAPGKVVAAAPYWWVCDQPLTCIDAASERLEPVEDLENAFRRWLASRIAWEMRGRPRPTSQEEWQRALGVTTMSIDARIAIQALVAEEDGNVAQGLPPGFRAPDDAFERTPP